MESWQLLLTVKNAEKLEKGALPKSYFSHDGGIIGSKSDDCHWFLSDYRGEVRPHHCEIVWMNHQFCVIDRCGQTFINASRKALGKDVVVALRSGDHLQIGKYITTVELAEDFLLPQKAASMEEIFDINSAQLLSAKVMPEVDMPDSFSGDILSFERDEMLDPLQAFARLEAKKDALKKQESLLPMDNRGLAKAAKVDADYSSTTIESV